MRSRAALIMLMLSSAGDPAQSRSLSFSGNAGYLSEWQISATVSDAGSERSGALSGPVTMKHTGLCAVEGLLENFGEMSVELSGWGPFSKIDIRMSFASAQCVYRGSFSEILKGFMDCSDARSVPVELSIK